MDEGHGASTVAEMMAFRRQLEPVVSIKFGGPYKAGDTYAFLGISRERFKDSTVLRAHRKYVTSILKTLNFEEGKTKSVGTPGQDITVEPDDLEYVGEKDHGIFRSVVGSALYLSRNRVDLIFPVKELGRWLSEPCMGMWKNLKRLGRYLVDKEEYCVVLRRGVRDGAGYLPMPAISDTNWAACKRTRKSTACFHISMGLQAPLMTLARTQTIVADSSGTAEWYGGVSAAAELLFSADLADWLGLRVRPTLHLDSAAAIGISKRIGVGRLRTIEVKTLWLQQYLGGGTQQHRGGEAVPLRLFKVAGENNCADIGTKNVPQARLVHLLAMCGTENLKRGTEPTTEGTDCLPSIPW